MKKLVYIADDDELVLHTIKDKLEQSGFDVGVAINESQVKDLFKNRTPDVFLVDFLFTSKNGVELVEDLAQTVPNIKKNCILMTSLKTEGFLSKVVESGITYVVKKDTEDFSQLIDLVKQVSL